MTLLRSLRLGCGWTCLNLLIPTLLVVWLHPASSLASLIEVGVGTTSATGGRVVPALSGSLTSQSWGVFASATGVKTSFYFHSNYQVSGYWLYPKIGTMWGGSISAGFGLGGMFMLRSFQDEGSATEEKSDDFLAGPAGRIRWSYFDWIYIGIDTVWGLRSLTGIVSLNYQDYTCVSIGVML